MALDSGTRRARACLRHGLRGKSVHPGPRVCGEIRVTEDPLLPANGPSGGRASVAGKRETDRVLRQLGPCGLLVHAVHSREVAHGVVPPTGLFRLLPRLGNLEAARRALPQRRAAAVVP
eukprot:12286027-Alexandrium_andersonii.AAC.1